MKIIDAFTFYNELDMLEYRLNILDSCVDYFILVEATLSHRGKPKILYYQENKERFAKFHHKIIHIIDDKLKTEKEILEDTNFVSGMAERKNKAWWNENHQRNSIDRGLNQLELKDEDLIIIADVDEIPDPRKIISIKYDKIQTINYVNLHMDMYYYNLTCKSVNPWFLTKIVSKKFYTNKINSNPNDIRITYTAELTVPNAGWHLSYFGDPKFIQNKLVNFAHQEFNSEQYTDLNKIEERIKNGSDLFDRKHEQWINIPIHINNNLPPQYEKYLQNYLGSFSLAD